MYASTILRQAESWLERKESNGTHKEIIDIYNAHKPLARSYKVKYTDSWCATYISAVAIVCGATDIIPLECSCGRMIELAQKMGIWVESDTHTPSPGDIIMYDWDDSGKGDNTGWPEHVGYVVSVNNGKIKVIEGNLDNKVGYREIAVNGRYIRGYICPKYAKEPKAEEKPVQNTSNAEYYPQYTGESNSIVDALKSMGIDSSMNHRKEIAKANGIEGYKGTAQQNGEMLSLLKAGKLLKSSVTANKAQQTTSTVKYYKKYTGKSGSLVDALKSLKIDSSFSNRKKIAKANGITLYLGTAKQNTTLLNLLKQGKLKQ